MTDKLSGEAQLGIDVGNYLAGINKVIDANVRLQNQYPQLNAALSKQEKALAQSGAAAKGMIGGANGAAAATTNMAAATTKANTSLISQRYALYDVSRSFTAVSGVTLGFAIASAKVAIDFQKNFASVQRVTGATGTQLETLRQNLINLSTSIPTSFADLAGIATLGGQLGIATSGITAFTSVVARLSATTDLSAEAAGTALGRFQALMGVPSTEFENLASSILKVGVTTVATESQIVNIGTQISSMGAFAGLTAAQVVGLSAALASTGTQPELARGTITRLFTKMSVAVSAGGEALNKFAQVSGVSAEQFKSAWGTDAFGAIFTQFISGIAGSGQDAVKTLNALGISSVRDVPALMRLAGAGDLLKTSLSDATQSYKDGTELGKQYAITAGTVAAKLTELGNTLQAILASGTGGALAPLAGILDFFSSLAKTIQAFAGTGVGQVVGTTVLALSLFIGVITALKAAETLVTASAYAFITATEGINASTLGASGGLTSMASKMALLTVGTTRVTAAQNAYSTSIAAGNTKLGSVTRGMGAAATATNGLGGAFKSLAVGSIWMLALGAGIAILSNFAQENQAAAAHVDELTNSLNQQTGALTDVTTATVRKALLDNGTLDTANRLGINLEMVTQAALGNADAIKYLSTVQESAKITADQLAKSAPFTSEGDATAKAAGERYNNITGILKSVGVESDGVSEAQKKLALNIKAGGGAATDAATSETDLVSSMKDVLDTSYAIVGGTVDMQNAMYSLGTALQENGTSFDQYSVGGRANLDALQKTLSTMVSASGGDATTLATMIAGLMQSLGGMGVDTVNQLGFVQDALAQLTGGKGTSGLAGVSTASKEASNALGQGFSAGAAKAAKSASKTKDEVKTLTDYVSNLGSVFKSAFDIRFGLSQSLDSTSASWAKMATYADDAKNSVDSALQAILEADAKIRGLNASNTTLTYQLQVAQQYGDTLRANEILAQMTQNNADLSAAQTDRTKSTKDLSKAQDANTKTLTGDSQAAQDQRAMVLDLVSSYEDQIKALANTGLSQADLARQTAILKQQFIAQLTQMGYNRTEVDKYAVAFDDLTAAIARVPRTINVSANTDPAQRAIDEFLAKNANQNVGVTASVTGSNANLGNAAFKTMTADDLAVQRINSQLFDSLIFKSGQTPGSGVLARAGGGLVPQYLAGGGMPGGPSGTDTIPAWLTPGEVVQQKQAVDYYGLPFMTALNNMQVPRYLATGGPAVASSGGSNGGIQLVELLPTQLAQLAAAVSTELNLDGRVLSDAVSHSNMSNARRGSN